MSKKKSGLTRRQFIGTVATGAAAAAALTIVPRHVVAGAAAGTAPSERLNVAFVGIGGRGRDDLNDLSPHVNVFALCDVDQKQGGGSFDTWPKAKKFQDFRKMLDEIEKSIDGVCVATPDHTHAVVAMNAIKRKKAVYCEKPLAHSVWEIRELGKAARANNVTTQLGNQGHSFQECAMLNEWIHDGAIGTVKEVHVQTDRFNSVAGRVPDVTATPPVPANLDWDLWLGPAKQRPYNPAYLPGRWRQFYPFGTGSAGDWMCHVVDPPFWALDLGSPTSLETSVQDFDLKRDVDTFPRGSKTKFEFPAKGNRPAVTLTWYEGSMPAPRPADLEAGRNIETVGGYMIGDKGAVSWGMHGARGLRIFPEAKMQAYKRPPATLPRGIEAHKVWVDAVKAGKKANSDFAEYGGPLSELAMLVIIGGRFAGQKLLWDGPNMKFTNCPEAAAMVTPEFRKGWTL